MLSRTQIRTHLGSYQTISSSAPIGLQILKSLSEVEDSTSPTRARLVDILANDFRDLENGKERSKSREDVISQTLSRSSRYNKYQTDVSQAWCITNADKTHTVLFEGIRFVVFLGDTEWIRIPLSGRLEVRPTVVPSTGAKSGEVVLRKQTMDLSAFWKRKEELEREGRLVIESPVPQVAGAFELPAHPELVSGHKPAIPSPQQYKQYAPHSANPPWMKGFPGIFKQGPQNKFSPQALPPEGRNMESESTGYQAYVPPSPDPGPRFYNPPPPTTYQSMPREPRNMQSAM